MDVYDTCLLCGNGDFSRSKSVKNVPSNVRAHKHERFVVWRCTGCCSIHAYHKVDFHYYYNEYPFSLGTINFFSNQMYLNQLRYLKQENIKKHHSILDYGCGNGLLVSFLKQKGYLRTFGYDPYNEKFSDQSVLNQTFDCVILLDVIEHVEDPIGLLKILSRLLNTGGVMFIGTPRAEGISLKNLMRDIHSLHQPYHRHILSEKSISMLLHQSTMRKKHIYYRQLLDTPIPGVNSRFFKYIMFNRDCAITNSVYTRGIPVQVFCNLMIGVIFRNYKSAPMLNNQ